MRERLNVRLTAAVLVTALLAAGAVALVHRWQVKRCAPGLIELARVAEDKGRADRAQWLLAAYLSRNPHDTAARLKYAELSEALARDARGRLGAAAAYEQVLEAAPDRVETRRHLARLYAGEGRFADARKHLQQLPGGRDGDSTEARPADAGDVQLLAECQEGEDDLPGAEKNYRRAIALDPLRVAAYVRLAGVLRRAGGDRGGRDADGPSRRDEADRVMLDAVAANLDAATADPDGDRVRLAQARLARARYLLGAESNTSGSSNWVFRLRALSTPDPDLQAALRLDPASADVRLTAAGVAAARGNALEAREHLEAILKQAAEKKATCDARVYLELARLEARLGKPAEALDVLRKAASQSPQSPQLQLTQVTVALDAGLLPQASAALATLTRLKYAPEVLLVLNARLLMAEDKWEAARDALRDDRKLLTLAAPELLAEAHVLRGRCHEQLGDSDLARDQFEQALAVAPGQPDAVAGVARYLLAQGQLGQAVQRYAELTRARAVPAPIWLTYLRLRAVQFLSTKARLRDNAEEIARESDNLKRVRDEVTKALPDSADLVVLQSEIDDALGDTADATKRLEGEIARLKALRRTAPGGPTDKYAADERAVSLALARLLGRHAQARAAQQILDDIERAPGKPTVDSLLVRLALIEKDGDPAFGPAAEAARAMFNRADAERLAAPAQARLATGLAEAYAVQKQLPAAREWWQQVARLQPRNLAARFRLFDLAARARDRAGMEDAVRAIRAAEGEREQGFAHYAAALLINRSYELAAEANDPAGTEAARARFGEALAHLDEAARLRPTWATVFVLRAGIYRGQNNNDRAIAEYNRAVELGEQRPEVVRQIVEFFHDNGRLDLADALIKRLPAESDPKFQKMAAELSLHNSRLNEAVTLAEGYLRAESNRNPQERYKDHLWHAAILSAAGRKKEEVLAAFDKAKEAAGPHAAPWVALVDWHLKAGRRHEAELAFREAGDRLKGVDLAQCLELFGERDKAGDVYRAALAARPNDATVLRRAVGFYERTAALGKAVPLLEAGLAARPPLAPEDAAWARRLVPVALAFRGDYGAFKEARRLAEEAVRTSGDGPENTFVLVQVLATRLEFRKEALELLKGLRERQNKLQRPLDPLAQFLLARLLVDTGAWAEGRALLVKLSREGTEQNKVAALRFFVDRLVRRDDPDAEEWLDQLIAVAKDEPDTSRLRAALFVKQKNYRRAADFLTRAAAPLSDAAAGETNLNRLRFAAGLADELGREAGAGPTLLPLAEALYRRAAESPGRAVSDELALAGFLARRDGKLKEAIERFRAAAPKAGAMATAVALVTAAYSYAQPPLTEAAVDALAAEAEAFLAAVPPNAGTRTLSALMCARRGRYAEAANVFEAVAKADPNDADARGNLAYMLVLDNRPDEARRYLEESANLGGTTAGVIDTRGMIALKTKRTGDAIADLEKAVEQKPSAAKCVHLAAAYRAGGRLADAKATLARAGELEADGSLSLPAERKLFAELDQILKRGK